MLSMFYVRSRVRTRTHGSVGRRRLRPPLTRLHFERLTLQIPSDRHRCHYVKTKVHVHRYKDGTLAVFHGPRQLAAYDAQGMYKQPEIKDAV